MDVRRLLSYVLADRGAISLLWRRPPSPLSVEAPEGLPWRNIGSSICIFFRRHLAASQAISVIFLCLSWSCVIPRDANQEPLPLVGERRKEKPLFSPSSVSFDDLKHLAA